jgi:hypothetical protein
MLDAPLAAMFNPLENKSLAIMKQGRAVGFCFFA